MKIWDVEAAMTYILREEELIVVGELNVDLLWTYGRGRDDDIAAAMATAGIEDLVGHFLSRRKI